MTNAEQTRPTVARFMGRSRQHTASRAREARLGVGELCIVVERRAKTSVVVISDPIFGLRFIVKNTDLREG